MPEPLRFEQGWLSGSLSSSFSGGFSNSTFDVSCLPSPNRDDRPTGVSIDMVVIHFISLPPDRFGTGAAVELFTNRLDLQADTYYAALANVRVSAHFFIDRLGGVTQLVSCDKRAWHAGLSEWQGRTRCNDFSIGIEMEGSETQPFAQAQYDALCPLLAILGQHYPLKWLVGHSDIAPDRKIDPGPHFDWQRLASVSAGLCCPHIPPIRVAGKDSKKY